MKAIKNSILISFLICCTLPFSFAQDGQNKSSVAGGASFWLEPLWGTQIDPRWKAGEVIGDVEDGITVEFVEFSADGKLLVTGNGQGEAFVLDAADGSIMHTFTYITEEDVNRLDKEMVSNISGGFTKSLEVECGAFTPDDRFLVIGGNLNGIKIFDLTDGSLVRHLEVQEEVDGLSISPDGRFFAYASFRSAKVLAISNWEMIQNVEYGKDSKGSVVNSINFTVDGNFMVIAGNAGNVKLVNTRDWKTVGDGIIPDATSIKSVRFSPDERLIAAGNGGGEVTIWRTWDMSLLFQFSSLVYIEAVAWSSDGRYLIAGGRDDGEGRILVFRTSDWQMVGNPSVLADGASIEYIDVHGNLVAIAGEDAHVRLYRINTKMEK
jgi:WD40 repeat protein